MTQSISLRSEYKEVEFKFTLNPTPDYQEVISPDVLNSEELEEFEAEVYEDDEDQESDEMQLTHYDCYELLIEANFKNHMQTFYFPGIYLSKESNQIDDMALELEDILDQQNQLELIVEKLKISFAREQDPSQGPHWRI